VSKRLIILVSVALAIILAAGAYIVLCSRANRRVESLTCASSITSICLAAHVWAEYNSGFMPTNFICMSNEVSAPKILSCIPARRARTENWADFSPENCTYEILAPGMRVDDTNTAFLRCTIHGHLGYSDTTVFDGVRRRHKFE
jgi:hypothetical protein